MFNVKFSIINDDLLVMQAIRNRNVQSTNQQLNIKHLTLKIATEGSDRD